MYRRIEFITLLEADPRSPEPDLRTDTWTKHGLCGVFGLNNAPPEQHKVFDEFVECLMMLKGVGTGKNNRYYFTELGWEKIGRKMVECALKLKFDYRILCIKENSVDVMATDNKYEVAVRPRKRRY